MDADRKLFIPVILGTPRQDRMSENVAKLVIELIESREGLETQLIDIRGIPLSHSDAGESIKDPDFSTTAMRADAFVIVAPE